MIKLETARKFDFKIYPGHFHRGLLYGYPICCIMYFQYVWPLMKYEIPESNRCNQDRIMCPDCIVRSVGKK